MADENVKTIKIKIETAMGDAANKLDGLSKATQGVTKNLGGIAPASGAASVAVGAFTGKLAADVVEAFGRAIASAVNQIIDLGAQAEKSIASLSAMKNLVGDATEAYRTFNDVARSTNFDIPAVQQMGSQLVNVGYSAQNAAALIKLCSDTAAGLGKGQAGAQQLVDTFTRIQNVGKLTSMQLMRLKFLGLDLDRAFESLHMTADEAMKAMDEGALDSQTAIRALTDYMQEFDGSMEQSKKNIIDIWGDVKGNISTVFEEIGLSIFNAFNQSEIVQDLMDFTQDLVNLVRSEGTGAFNDLKEVAEIALDIIAVGLKGVYQSIKIVIVGVAQMYSAFKSVGARIANALAPILQPLSKIWNYVKSLLSSLGQKFNEYVDTDFGRMFRVKDNSNSFGFDPTEIKGKNRKNASGGKGGGKGGGGKGSISEEEKKIKTLIEKYTDADKAARELAKKQIEIAKVNISMMSNEQKAIGEKEVKLKSLELAHSGIIKGYEKELEVAEKINDPKTKDDVIKAINAQITAENALNDAKKRQIEYEDAIKQRKLQSEDFSLDMQHIQNLASMWRISANQRIEMENEVLQARKKQLEENLLDTTLHKEQRIKLEQELADTIKQINANAAYDVKGAWEQALLEIANQQINFKDAFTSVFDSIESGLVNLITAAGSAKDKFKNFLNEVTNSILKAMTQIIIKGLITNAIMAALGMGKTISLGWTGRASGTNWGANPFSGALFGASGGLVTGAGTSTSDSIPAMLSNGEYVLNAAAVKRIGVPKLNAINNGGVPRFADGGYVGGYVSNGNNAPNVVINVENQTGSNVEMEQSGSKFDGEKWIISVVMKGMANNTMGMRSAFKGVTS